MPAVNFDRTPYTVEYYKNGKKEKLKRIPPPKLHDILPEDVVTITRKKNVDWGEGDEVKVKNITKRQPNTLQVLNEDSGKTTFLSFYDVLFEGRPDEEEQNILSRDQAKRAADPLGSDYLLWP